MSATMLKDATIASHASGWVPRAGVDVLIVDGRIAEMGHGSAFPEGAEVVDASRWLVMPGLHNSHTHSPEVLARGRASGATLDEWLTPVYRDLDAIGDERVAKAIAIAAREMAGSGAVSVTDHFRQLPQDARTIIAAGKAWARTGLNARMAINLRDKYVPQGLPTQSIEELVRVMSTAIDALGPTAVGPGPSAPHRCSDALLRSMSSLAQAAGSFLHMHVCETAANAQECRSLYGRSAVAHLHEVGFLGPRTELVHCVHLDDADFTLMADSGTALVHCPLANMRLGSGIASVMRAHRAGVDVRLATDGAASNDAQSMLEVVKMTVLLSQMRADRSEWVTPELALSMATRRASLEAGQPADLLAFDLGASCFEESTPDELVPRAVLAAREGAIAWTMAGGRRVWSR